MSCGPPLQRLPTTRDSLVNPYIFIDGGNNGEGLIPDFPGARN